MADADPLSETLLIGTPYKAVARLGSGGMGEVVAAQHIALGKPVVVKLLHQDLARQPHQVERMRVEAQSLARLAHPNLVMVTDFGQTPEGRPYLVMERLLGRTLKDELTARGVIPLAEALELTRQVLAGLAAAHGLGLVHRDVKLENLYICDADAKGHRAVKVLDFGIAKVMGSTGGAPEPSKFPTAEGVLLGTPRFLSPEQAMGKAVDVRTDIYSTGMVLYTLVSGRGPFQDIRALPELLRAHAYVDPQPPSKLSPQAIPAELDRVVLKALAKKPDDRYQDAASFSAELETALSSKPKRWETTEPLASSPRAQQISAAARAAIAAAAAKPNTTTPMKQVSGPGGAAHPSSPQIAAVRQSAPQQGGYPAAPQQQRAAQPAPATPPTQTMTAQDGTIPVTPQPTKPAKKFERTVDVGAARQSSAVLPFVTPASVAIAKPTKKSSAPWIVVAMIVLGVLAAAGWFFLVRHR